MLRSGRRLVFVAAKVPAFGFHEFKFTREAGPSQSSLVRATRTGISSPYYRCNIARGLLKEDYRGFATRSADSPLLQFFCGIAEVDRVRVPSKSTLQRYDLWWPETQVRQLAIQLLQTGAQEPEKLQLPEAVDLETCFLDTTCVAANIHYPVDWVLLRDATRTLMKAVQLIRGQGLTLVFRPWAESLTRCYAIMPSTVRLSDRELLTAIRCHDETKAWIETYRSLDDGEHWSHDTVPAPDLGTGNPPSMIRLRDGRICLTYGQRRPPYSICARMSDDTGRTWEPEIILRDDGGGTDIGYPRSVQRPDGQVVTIYYFHDQPKGDRYIAATLWSPGRSPSGTGK